MNELQEKSSPPQTQTKKFKTEAETSQEAPPQKPLPWVHDLDFWRFVLAALSLAWEIAKTFVR